MDEIILTKDLIIPAGTVLKNCDGLHVKFESENFEGIISTGKSEINIYLDKDVINDLPDHFEIIK